MEVFKKTKKLKKRRHRSDKIKKEKYYVEELLKVDTCTHKLFLKNRVICFLIIYIELG